MKYKGENDFLEWLQEENEATRSNKVSTSTNTIPPVSGLTANIRMNRRARKSRGHLEIIFTKPSLIQILESYPM